MSWQERARRGYDRVAGRADAALDRAGGGERPGEVDRTFRDLGVLAYLEATGRPASPGERQRLLAALSALEQRGAIRSLTIGEEGPPQPPPERAGRHGSFLMQPRGGDVPPPAPGSQTPGPPPPPRS